MQYGINLTDEQVRAVTSDPGIVQVVAGPGTGKTRCVTARTIHLLSTDRLSRILVLSHTRKAISEITARVRRSIPSHLMPRVKIMTLHGFCLKLARIIGVIDEKARLLENGKRREFLSECMRNYPVLDNIEDCLSVIENCKNLLITPEESYCLLPQHLADLYQIYEREKQRENLFDFEDMLVFTYRRLSSDHKLAQNLRNQFQHIIVDEAHDMNKAQYEIVRLIQSGSLFTVLDPNQRIYAFRAGGGPLHRLRYDFPGSAELPLTINFRSTKKIVDCTNRLMNVDIKPRQNAEEGQIDIMVERTWEKQIKCIAKRIAEIEENNARHTIAILTRTNLQAVSLAAALKDHGIKSNIKTNGNNKPPENPSLWQKALSLLNKLSPSDDEEVHCNGEVKVTISTIHKAKGREWDHVIVPDVVHNLPCLREGREDEEKRILYVATTRPRISLTLTAAKECYGHRTKPSRYLEYFS